ncbi:MAG TPA: tyrosine-type recombinase/integrase [Mycobacteriales bacterium]|nr:tyrosine-type recombinase/integrase [Mycobacteriales bacterium]
MAGPRSDAGSLAVFVEPLRSRLTDRGYAASTVKSATRLLSSVACWPGVRRLGRPPLSEAALRRAIARRMRRGECSAGTARHAGNLIAHLRELGAITVAGPTASEQLLADFVGYQIEQRRLSALTARSRADVVRRFLAWGQAELGDLELAGLSVGDVHRFVLFEAHRLQRASLGPVLSSMRSFLRFTYATGLMGADLSSALPAVTTRQHPAVRPTVDAATLAALLGSCDRSTPTGRRDFAIITLLVRLGLRAHEVAQITLDDIDWRAGELLVHGKGRREERMPLPADVGEALVDYLQHGRPLTPSRVVFQRAKAPAGPLGRNGVVLVPRAASRRAGIPIVASHRLRHTTATTLLRAGASWTEVGQVLRHARTQTSAIYASAHPDALAEVVHPWPATTAGAQS